jgi:HAD superfamily hydrolase (TIGR01459 family)
MDAAFTWGTKASEATAAIRIAFLIWISFLGSAQETRSRAIRSDGNIGATRQSLRPSWFRHYTAASDADVVIISVSAAERVPVTEYRETLTMAAVCGVPSYCTNPDVHKLDNGSVAPGAGSIAKRHEELGGHIMRVWKPYSNIYEHARRMTGVAERGRVVCVGDSVERDILGAQKAELVSALVRAGMLATASDDKLRNIFPWSARLRMT